MKWTCLGGCSRAGRPRAHRALEVLGRRAAATGLLVLIAVTACGGSDGDPAAEPSPSSASATATPSTTPSASPSATARPTRSPSAQEAYVAASEDVCSEANDEFDEIAEAFDGPLSGYAAALREQVDLAEDTNAQLVRLAAERPDRARLSTIFLTPVQKQVREVEAFLPTLEQQVRAGKEPGFPALTKADEAAMEAYGFEECVEWASTS